jgi:hypothetical protein
MPTAMPGIHRSRTSESTLHAEPLSATLYRAGPEVRFSLLSRGDRVAGRLVAPEHPQALPLVLLLAADGRAWGCTADAAIAAWSPRMAVASIDLPLCGTRASDKVDLARIVSDDPTGARLRGDVETQLASDLERTLALLRTGEPRLGSACTGLVALGSAAQLVATLAAHPSGLRAIGLASPLTRSPAPSAGSACEILTLDPPEDPPGADWLARTGAWLDRALG